MTLTAPAAQQPLLVFYSRTGKTSIVAHELAKKLSCKTEEVQSTEPREGMLGAFTCVLDQLLDRDDQLLPCNREMSAYNPIIIATPIWLGKISSPMRTFINQTQLQGKDIYIVLTFNGRLTGEKEKAILDTLALRGITPKALYKVITKEKSEDEIIKDIDLQLDAHPIPIRLAGTM